MCIVMRQHIMNFLDLQQLDRWPNGWCVLERERGERQVSSSHIIASVSCGAAERARERSFVCVGERKER